MKVLDQSEVTVTMDKDQAQRLLDDLRGVPREHVGAEMAALGMLLANVEARDRETTFRKSQETGEIETL